MSAELTADLKAALTQMSQVCENLAYYVENAHFDGYHIRRSEYDQLIADLPQLFQAWDRANDRERTEALLISQAEHLHQKFSEPGAN